MRINVDQEAIPVWNDFLLLLFSRNDRSLRYCFRSFRLPIKYVRKLKFACNFQTAQGTVCIFGMPILSVKPFPIILTLLTLWLDLAVTPCEPRQGQGVLQFVKGRSELNPVSDRIQNPVYHLDKPNFLVMVNCYTDDLCYMYTVC